MPAAKDSISHRGASAVRTAHRYAPYSQLSTGGRDAVAAPHASPTSLSRFQSQSLSYVPPPPSEASVGSSPLSSASTLTTSSFSDSPESVVEPSTRHRLYRPVGNKILQQRKLRYLNSLINFTCKLLTDTWPTQSIPPVFLHVNGASFGYTSSTVGIPYEQYCCPSGPSDLADVKHFVMELLRRSRSTCNILQTALCYLEVVRQKVPELQKLEQDGIGSRGEQYDKEEAIVLDPTLFENGVLQELGSRHRKKPEAPGTPLPPLPSPLLCPRRTFMASLLLATKFVQEKSYSNRAWAKLCGIAPREVSRCERTLGEALGWRLWVGKETGFSFPGLESSFGKEPSFAQISMDGKFLKESTLPGGLAWTPTLRIQEQSPLPCTQLTVDALTISPTPSLSSSACLSSGSSQNLPTPQSTFVSNDPFSPANHGHRKHAPAKNMHYPAVQGDEDAFDMRVVTGNIAV
ncbi:hypothetical protein SISNIDRAFT_481183 [Sistotremastrum niveocremeum HHB9708]|uniref:Cyclin N-terminal domain-containing protein n=1 Tax=Sistotremastrum niveocremeum HHB9708 TaxID=1314777 RepID=A0A165A3P6_9AGAM|nr:hypothetical protein SISNIDRAFT_481183 [Sistotremastrum niveocremeum HHB9708]